MLENKIRVLTSPHSLHYFMENYLIRKYIRWPKVKKKFLLISFSDTFQAGLIVAWVYPSMIILKNIRGTLWTPPPIGQGNGWVSLVQIQLNIQIFS